MIDYTIIGTKLPHISDGIEYRVDYYTWDGVKNHIDFYDCFKNHRDKLVSFGTKEYLGETYILAEKPEYEETSYFMFKLEDLNKLTNNMEKREIIGYKIIKQYPGLRKEYVGTIILSPIYKLPDTTMVPGTIFEKDSIYYNADFIKEFFEPIYKEEFTYKVGDYLYCIKDFVMNDGDIRFKKDKIYKSENTNRITDERNSKDHYMIKNLSIYFRHATPEEIAKIQEERIVMAEGFELIIKDNEIIHEKDKTNITDYVKSIVSWWRHSCDKGMMSFNGYDFTIKPENIIPSKTGCQSNKEVTLKQWLDLYDKIK